MTSTLNAATEATPNDDDSAELMIKNFTKRDFGEKIAKFQENFGFSVGRFSF